MSSGGRRGISGRVFFAGFGVCVGDEGERAGAVAEEAVVVGGAGLEKVEVKLGQGSRR